MHDTCTIHTDSIVTKTLYKTKFDTIVEIEYIDSIKHDTLRITDTISLPIEHKVDSFTLKRDSLTITEKIYHNGFRSNIDSIDFSYDFHYTLKKKKKIQLTWSIGPAIGYGFGLNGNTIVGTPYLGIGATIGFGNVIETK